MFPKKGIDQVKVIGSGSPVSTRSEDVAISVDENLPLIHKEQIITIETGPTEKEQKTAENKKKKKGAIDEDEPDMDALDWWSKYFASVETMIREEGEEVEEHGHNEDVFNVKLLEAESKTADTSSPAPLTGDEQTLHPQQTGQSSYGNYGSIPNGQGIGGDEVEIKQAKRLEKEAKKQQERDRKATFKSTAKTVGLAKQLSPKAQRKREKLLSSTSQLKVHPTELEVQPQYDGFRDWLHTFELYRGKNTGNDEPDENRIVGKFKGSMKIYKIPLPPDIEDTTITGE
ncbi:otoferlin, partial [Aplysia californica]|uniref:Otoferlin n=1 Tax=Aplysia californica TaxID=6500 RepID=A0ABM1VW06_APLCA